MISFAKTNCFFWFLWFFSQVLAHALKPSLIRPPKTDVPNVPELLDVSEVSGVPNVRDASDVPSVRDVLIARVAPIPPVTLKLVNVPNALRIPDVPVVLIARVAPIPPAVLKLVNVSNALRILNANLFTRFLLMRDKDSERQDEQSAFFMVNIAWRAFVKLSSGFAARETRVKMKKNQKAVWRIGRVSLQAVVETGEVSCRKQLGFMVSAAYI